jgi:hypothetical protein
MKKIIKQIILSVVVVLGLVAVFAPTSTYAYSPGCTGKNCLNNSVNAIGNGQNKNLEGQVTNIINAAIYVIGFIAVAMVIYGGVRYTTSAGAADKVTSAKNTIMYGIIGLVVAVLAFAIVNFVISAL